MMIRYAYDRKLGHVYYELMPGGELREVDPHVVLAALNAKQPPPVDQPTDHWSPWLEWRGGPCPLPEGVIVEYRTADGGFGHFYANGLLWRRESNTISSFRYRADNPAGWLPRGDWIPPDELWDDGCPVRCEWTTNPELHCCRAKLSLSGWTCSLPPITHIRLVAREANAGLPEAQPEPGAVPELPEWIYESSDGFYHVVLDARTYTISKYSSPDDLDRIAEACRVLAARERARRAGS